MKLTVAYLGAMFVSCMGLTCPGTFNFPECDFYQELYTGSAQSANKTTSLGAVNMLGFSEGSPNYSANQCNKQAKLQLVVYSGASAVSIYVGVSNMTGWSLYLGDRDIPTYNLSGNPAENGVVFSIDTKLYAYQQTCLATPPISQFVVPNYFNFDTASTWSMEVNRTDSVSMTTMPYIPRTKLQLTHMGMYAFDAIYVNLNRMYKDINTEPDRVGAGACAICVKFS